MDLQTLRRVAVPAAFGRSQVGTRVKEIVSDHYYGSAGRSRLGSIHLKPVRHSCRRKLRFKLVLGIVCRLKKIQEMDAASLVIGIPGLIQACVQGYRFTREILDLDKTVLTLRLRYRIEECRLVLWAGFWGLALSNDNIREEGSQDSHIGLLEIPEIRALITDVLNQMLVLLEDTRRISERYNGDLIDRQRSIDEPSRDRIGQLRARPDKRSSLPLPKVRWTLKDKPRFSSTLNSLTSLNDGLEKLLPRQQRLKLGQALVGEVLYEEGIVPGMDESYAIADALNGTDDNNARTLPRRKTPIDTV